jgi:pyruvate dehydrogenase E1 component
VFYYITVMNENYPHPPLPPGVEEGILRGMYLLEAGDAENPRRVQLAGSGTILREVLAAARLLAQDFGVSADVWSAPSFTLLRRDGLAATRWNMLHPEAPPRRSYVEQCLDAHPGPVVAASDYLKSHADQIRPFLGRTIRVLGTDGYGRSDTRDKLRRFFEVDRHYVAVAALRALADDAVVPTSTVAEAIRKYGIDPEKPEPVST